MFSNAIYEQTSYYL